MPLIFPKIFYSADFNLKYPLTHLSYRAQTINIAKSYYLVDDRLPEVNSLKQQLNQLSIFFTLKY